MAVHEMLALKALDGFIRSTLAEESMVSTAFLGKIVLAQLTC